MRILALALLLFVTPGAVIAAPFSCSGLGAVFAERALCDAVCGQNCTELLPADTDAPACDTVNNTAFVYHEASDRTFALTNARGMWSSSLPLAVIDDEAVNALLAGVLSIRNAVPWIGATDPGRSARFDTVDPGRFVWRDGTAMTFTAWKDGQPDNHLADGDLGAVNEPGEHFAYMNGAGLWEDDGFHAGYMPSRPSLLQWRGALSCVVGVRPATPASDPSNFVELYCGGDLPCMLCAGGGEIDRCGSTVEFGTGTPDWLCPVENVACDIEAECAPGFTMADGTCGAPPACSFPDGTVGTLNRVTGTCEVTPTWKPCPTGYEMVKYRTVDGKPMGYLPEADINSAELCQKQLAAFSDSLGDPNKVPVGWPEMNYSYQKCNRDNQLITYNRTGHGNPRTGTVYEKPASETDCWDEHSYNPFPFEYWRSHSSGIVYRTLPSRISESGAVWNNIRVYASVKRLFDWGDRRTCGDLRTFVGGAEAPTVHALSDKWTYAGEEAWRSGFVRITANGSHEINIEARNYECGSASGDPPFQATAYAVTDVNRSMICPAGWTPNYSRNRCERAPTCPDGSTYEAGQNECVAPAEWSAVCPTGDNPCLRTPEGGWACSPNGCSDANQASTQLDDTTEGLNDLFNDGEMVDGVCMGQVYLFNGEDRRCRRAGSQTLRFNCCNSPTAEELGVTDTALLLGFAQGGGGVVSSILGDLSIEMNICTPDERMLSVLRAWGDLDGNCHAIGSYCAERWLGTCVQRKETYCCYDSPLARIFVEEAHRQLGIDWGTPKVPNCRGLTPDEFQKVDWSNPDMQAAMDEWVEGYVMPKMNGDISGTPPSETAVENLKRIYGE